MSEHRLLLEEAFAKAELAFIKNESPAVVYGIDGLGDLIFASSTQAYREVLLGCVLTRIIDKTKDIQLPYAKLGKHAFNGRSLDEQVINPFLREKNAPCSRGPYLSVFRRSVAFTGATREGLKDKKGYDALLTLIETVRNESDNTVLKTILAYLLYNFILLREESRVELTRLRRISLSQFRNLIASLVSKKSGGRFPVLLIVSMLEAFANRFSLNWRIQWQGINVADAASGVGGDITVTEGTRTVIVVEVTERPVDAATVRATFSGKIAPSKIQEYMFMVHTDQAGTAAREQADKYFMQGYEVSFVDMWEWLTSTLATVGSEGRQYFQECLLRHLSDKAVPNTLKLMWNEEAERLVY
jgi:hypothetical protein